jgi:hypothetical protein
LTLDDSVRIFTVSTVRVGQTKWMMKPLPGEESQRGSVWFPPFDEWAAEDGLHRILPPILGMTTTVDDLPSDSSTIGVSSGQQKRLRTQGQGCRREGESCFAEKAPPKVVLCVAS